MNRFSLTDAQWPKMQPFCLGKASNPGRTAADARLFTEAVPWVACTDSPWRDLPTSFGNCNSMFKLFHDWVKAGVFKRMFDAVSDEPGMEYAMVDATIVRVHLHGQGANRGPQNQAIGKSRSGLTTKILALTDALGNLFRFVQMPSQRHDTIGGAPLIKGVEFGCLIADKACDASWIVSELNQRGAKIVVSQMPQRKQPLDIDREIYTWRHLIGNFFCKLKEFKRIAIRSDKTDTSFGARIYPGLAAINSR